MTHDTSVPTSPFGSPTRNNDRSPGPPAVPKGLVLGSLILAAFVINLDTTIVNVALPALVRELRATDTQLQWVVDAYNLVFAALLLTFGNLSDRFGRKGMLLTGLGVFGLASVAGGLTTSPDQLIASRAVMGLRSGDGVSGHPFSDRERLHGAKGAGAGDRPMGRKRGGQLRSARSWAAGCWSTSRGRPSSSHLRRWRRFRQGW